MFSAERVLEELARIAGTLKNGELRLLLYLWSAAIQANNLLIEASFRSLAEATGMSLYRTYQAAQQLRQRRLLRIRPGSANIRSHFCLCSLREYKQPRRKATDGTSSTSQ